MVSVSWVDFWSLARLKSFSLCLAMGMLLMASAGFRLKNSVSVVWHCVKVFVNFSLVFFNHFFTQARKLKFNGFLFRAHMETGFFGARCFHFHNYQMVI